MDFLLTLTDENNDYDFFEQINEEFMKVVKQHDESELVSPPFSEL